MSDPVQRVWPLSREPPGALTSGYTSVTDKAHGVALGKAGQSTRRAPNGGDTGKVHPAKAWASHAGPVRWPGGIPRESRTPRKRPVSASKCRSVVNRKAGENFEVRNIWLPFVGDYRTFLNAPSIHHYGFFDAASAL